MLLKKIRPVFLSCYVIFDEPQRALICANKIVIDFRYSTTKLGQLLFQTLYEQGLTWKYEIIPLGQINPHAQCIWFRMEGYFPRHLLKVGFSLLANVANSGNSSIFHQRSTMISSSALTLDRKSQPPPSPSFLCLFKLVNYIFSVLWSCSDFL